MFRVIKELRSYNQLEYRYLVQGTFQYKYHIAVSHKKLDINSAISAIRTEGHSSFDRKYLLNKYK